MESCSRVRWYVSLASLALICVAGCAAEASGPAPDSETAGTTTDQSGVSTPSDEAYSATGHFQVVETPEHTLGFSLTGKIGFDDEREVNRTLTPSLTGTYLALRSDLAVAPDVLVNLEKRFQSERQLAPKTMPQQDKSAAAFQATACQNFTYAGSLYTPVDCWYAPAVGGWLGMILQGIFNSSDVSFAWNETYKNGTHRTSGSTWQPAVPARSWRSTIWVDTSPTRMLASGGAWGGGQRQRRYHKAPVFGRCPSVLPRHF